MARRNDRPGGTVLLDLNHPEVQRELFGLERAELAQAIDSLRRLRRKAWNEVYRSNGLKWERLQHVDVDGKKAYSFRMSLGFRAIALRDGDFLRILSLHPDHDSTYEG